MVSQDMCDAKIITLYKNYGSRSDFNNYKGISLFAIAGKAFARVILSWLQNLAKRVYTSINVNLGLNNLPLTWYSLYASYKRNVMNRTFLYTLLLLTLLEPLT